MSNPKPIPDSAHTLLLYDPETGRVYRRLSGGNRTVGDECTSRTTNGKYLKTRLGDKDYLLHRVAWFLGHGDQPPPVIDHIDGNGLNNALGNLREATTSTNQMNIRATSKSTTGIKGIFPIRGGRLYRAEVCVDGKRHQKHSRHPEKLQAWVETMRAEHHGEFARS